jgi:ferredoxin
VFYHKFVLLLQIVLTLLQESGSQVIFYSDFISKGTKDSISILNQIYQAKYKKDAIIIAMDEEELKHALQEVSKIEDSKYLVNHENAKKREIFAIRLAQIVGNDDLGIVKTGENVHYAQVKVKEDNCALCLSCVGAFDWICHDPQVSCLKVCQFLGFRNIRHACLVR